MFPQYAARQNGGEIAIWLLITVGALLIPIIVIAICCIRRHLSRRPHIQLLDSRSPRMMKNTKQMESLRSYNGPCTESGNDDVGVSSENNTTLTFSRNNSLKKQHVHWPDRSTTPKIDDFYSMKHQLFPEGLNTTILTESPSTHRRVSYLTAPPSSLSNFIQTAIIPAGSTVGGTGANELLTSSKQFTSTPAGYDHIV